MTVMSDKEFHKLTEHEIKRFIALFDKMKEEFFPAGELPALATTVPPWGRLYELTFLELVTAAVVTLDLTGEVVAASQCANPQATILSLAEDGEPMEPRDGAEITTSVLFAALHSLRAISKYQVPISELVADASTGNLESALKAVRLDPQALYAQPIAELHCKALMTRDINVLKKFASALSGKLPRLPADSRDNMRAVVHLLEDAGAIQHMTVEALRQLVVDRLLVYPTDGLDAARAEWRAAKKRRGD